ncbi:ABC transporter permease [Thermocrispum municipale]|uniref:ABC transporter permease n=1 Tax=Thermocrispum municipale TaxID=37926 RepID=UPI00040107AA|nr:ABC transporter permease [Thermocrispum municipale]
MTDQDKRPDTETRQDGDDSGAVTTTDQKPDAGKPAQDEPSIGQRFLRELTTGSTALTILSVVLALLIGAILIVVSDPDVHAAASYFFSRPGDTFAAMWTSASEAYAAMFSGAIIDFDEYTVGRALRPFADSLTYATPLIAAGLAVALAFRTGLLNIGAQGQLILGAILAGYIGFAIDLPPVVHVVVAMLAGFVGGAIWGGIAGFIKATRGAHEVIVTIMLNYIALFLLAYLLTTDPFQREGEDLPRSPFMLPTAELWRPIEGSRLNLGLVFALLAAVYTWWLLNRSTMGFRFKAVGFNPHAATTAGISVGRSYTTVMFICGGLAGIAGATQVMGTSLHLHGAIAEQLGFDAITVALLGRSSPIGTVLAAILFGALRAGATTMQAQTQTPIDIVLVVQALIVLFIAAPPLVRAVFRIKVRATRPVAPGSGGLA